MDKGTEIEYNTQKYIRLHTRREEFQLKFKATLAILTFLKFKTLIIFLFQLQHCSVEELTSSVQFIMGHGKTLEAHIPVS